MPKHLYRMLDGIWLECDCISPFDNHDVISFGIVPVNRKRIPAVIEGDIKWNL